MIMLFLIAIGLVALVAIILLYNACYVVRQSESIIIERLGRYYRTLTPGFHIITPFIDIPRKVYWTYLMEDRHGRQIRAVRTTYRIDLRESVYDFPKQNVITKDNVTMQINALLYYHITHPHYAVYEFDDLPEGIEKLTQTTLRNVIGSMDLDETLSSRDEINQKLRVILDEATDEWGVKVSRVELQEITPPADIRQAMEKQMRAERDRRALILEAEGHKRSVTLRAEGDRDAAVLEARGKAESQVIEAQAEAESRLAVVQAEASAIERIRSSLPENIDPTQYMIAQQYIKALPRLTEGHDNKLIIVPYEASGLMSSLTGIKKLFNQVDETL